MKQVLLIAANFLREHRWPVLILFGWIVLIAAASADFGRERAVVDDVMFYLVQQPVYICIFCAFLAADAIHNERKSKRILLVLSKAVTRAQYLLAPALATFAMAIAYAVVYGLCGEWLVARAMLPHAGLWSMVLLAVVGSMIASTAALFFASFLNPYLSLAATLLLFASPGLLHAQRHDWSLWLPGFPILVQIVSFRLNGPWSVNWAAILLAVLQAVFFFGLGAVIFNRRDIAVPVE